MKIGIITVFITENCGSVLQAFSLKKVLENMGHNVYHISTKNSKSAHTYKSLIKNIILALKNRENIINPISKYISYDKFIKNQFNIIEGNIVNDMEMIIIGSDTVWDIDSPYFLESQDIFWARNLDCNKVITYAATFANSSYDKIAHLKHLNEQLLKIRKISVRDEYSRKYINDYINIETDVVCDPTLLLDREYYQKVEAVTSIDNYILLYLFDEPKIEVAKKIVEIAKADNLKIVSIGKKISFANEHVVSTIENFLGYYSNAEFIVTNTFHGTVFSIIYNKKFIVLDYNKKKINDLLCELKIDNRLCKDNDDIAEIIHQTINYYDVNNILKNKRKKSIGYLNKNISEIGDELNECKKELYL